MITEIPLQELEKTAKECLYVVSFAKKFSEITKRPLFIIFNARNGTIFSYGMPSIFKQLKQQLNKKKREIFWQEVKDHPDYSRNRKLAIIKTAGSWMRQGQLKYFIDFTLNFRYPSVSTHKIFIPDKIREIIDNYQIADILFVDTGYCLLPATIGSGFGQNKSIVSYLNIQNRKIVILCNKLYRPPSNFDEMTEQIMKDINTLISLDHREELFFIMLIPTYTTGNQEIRRPWFDNNPIALGPIGRKFAHESNHQPISQEEKNLYKKYRKIICSFIKKAQK